MAESADFVIRLIDKLTGPAKRMAAAMSGVQKALKPIQKNKAFELLDKAGTKLFDAAKSAAIFGTAIGVLAAGALTKAVIDTGRFAEGARLSFERLTGSAAKGEQAFGNVTALVKRFGLDLHDTTDAFRELLAQQFSIQESDELVRMVSDLRAIGVEGEKSKRVLTALTQIRAKGKVQQEELLQLAEAGISLKLVQDELQKSLGKTRDEVRKMQEAGKIDDVVAFEAIRNAVKKKLHITEFGQAGEKFANETLTGLLGRLRSAGQMLLLKLSEAVKPALESLKPLVDDLIGFVENIDTGNLTVVIESVIETMRNLIPLGKEFIGGFIEGLGDIGDKFAMDSLNPEALANAAQFGRDLAGALGTMLDIVRLLADAFAFLGTPLGKFLMWAGLAAIAVVKVIGLVSGLMAVLAPLSSAFAAVTAAMGEVWIFLKALLFIGTNLATFFGGALIGAFAAAGAAVALVIFQLKKLFDITTFAEIFAAMRANFKEFGIGVVKGMAEGIAESVMFVVNAAKNLGSTAVNAVRSTLGIHSPSTEFAKLGEFMGAGMTRGIDNSFGMVQRASADSFGDAPMSAASTASGGAAAMMRGRGATFNVTFQMGDFKDTSDRSVDEFAERAASKLQPLFEELAFEFGA